MKNRTSIKDSKSGYTVPAHYFDDLKGSIMTCVGDESRVVCHPGQVQVSWRVAIGRMGAFAAGFLLLVALAGTVFYFTADRAQKQEVADSSLDVIMLYNIDQDDILDANVPLQVSDSLLLADVAMSYFELYGYPEN